MQYSDLYTEYGEFKDINDIVSLINLSIDGDVQARWQFVLTQVVWIRQIILGNFPTHLRDEEAISDGILSLYKFMCNHKKKNIPLTKIREYAKYRIRRDIFFGIKYRNSQVMVRYSRKNVTEKSVSEGFTTFENEYLNKYGKDCELEDVTEEAPFDNLVKEDDAKFFKELYQKVSNLDHKSTQKEWQSLKDHFTDDGFRYDHGSSRTAIFNRRSKLINKLLRRFPELKEVIHNCQQRKIQPGGNSH